MVYLKVILILLIIATISTIAGLSIRLNYSQNSIDQGTTCEGGVCLPPEGY